MIVFCNGMGRAGSTYQYNLSRSAVEIRGYGRGEGFVFSWGSRDASSWRRDQKIHVVKSHDLHPDTGDWLRDGTARLCYIYRDLRDVAISIQQKWPERNVMEVLRESVELDEQVRRLDRCLIQRYEEVVQDPSTALSEITTYMGFTLTSDERQDVVYATSLERVNKKVASLRQSKWRKLVRVVWRAAGRERPVYDRTMLLHGDHVSKRRGEKGLWQRHLSRELLTEIEGTFGRWLSENGYVE